MNMISKTQLLLYLKMKSNVADKKASSYNKLERGIKCEFN